jgi:tetratricopeptide (TPR) repeat protein
MLGDTYLILKDYSTAYQIYNDMLKRTPENKSIWLKIFAIADNTRNYSFGLKASEQAQKQFSNDLSIDAYKAIFLIKNKKLEPAKSLIKKLELEQPDLPLLARLKGEVFLAEEDYIKAKHFLATFYSNYPSLISAQLLAEASANTGDVMKGAEYIQNELASSFVITIRDKNYLAEFYRLHGEFQEAANVYAELLEDDANNFITLNNYASTLIDIKQFDKAYEMANKALKIIPNSGYALDTAGWALMQKGEVKQALYYLDKAYNQSPTNTEIQMVDALYKDGQVSKARSIYKRISPRNSKEKEWHSKYRNLL